jgi:hypothetical protein
MAYLTEALRVVALVGIVVGGLEVVVTLRRREWSAVLRPLLVVAGAASLLYVVPGWPGTTF